MAMSLYALINLIEARSGQAAVVGGCPDFLSCVTYSIPSGSISLRKHVPHCPAG